MRTRAPLRHGAFMVLTAFAAIGCGGSGDSSPIPTTPTPAVVSSVAVSALTTSMTPGATSTLTATVKDASGNVLSRTVSWSSSAEALATVSQSGVVTAIAAGVATIQATSEGKSGTVSVTVGPTDISRIIDSVRQVFNLPALGAAIVTRTGGMIAVGVGGNRRWGTTTPVTLDDKWHLGSDTKTMTGLLAAITAKAGRVAWTFLPFGLMKSRTTTTLRSFHSTSRER